MVTHNVSVMVIQAGAARKVMDDRSRAGPRGAARGRGRRPGRDDRAAPRHGPAHDGQRRRRTRPVRRTWRRSRASTGSTRWSHRLSRHRGPGRRLTVTGQPRPVPAGVELAAYRVVQEALTNTVKHAAGATATVHVEYGADHLRVEVTDTGGAPGASAATGDGQRADRPARAARRLRRNPARRAAPHRRLPRRRPDPAGGHRDRATCGSSSPTIRRWSAPASG